jgi:hypothetical protein
MWDEAQLTKEERLAAEKKREEAAKAAEAAAAGAPAAEGGDSEAPADEALADDAAGGDDAITAGEMSADGMTADGMSAEGEGAAGPTGEGWVIQIVGHHFHNDGQNEGTQFVRSTLIKNLMEGSIPLPDGPKGEVIDVPYSELGISFPVIITNNRIVEVSYDPEAVEGESSGGAMAMEGPRMAGVEGMGRGIGGLMTEGGEAGGIGGVGELGPDGLPIRKLWKLRRYDFVVQFAWTPTPRHERQEKRAGGGDDEAAADEAVAGF